MFYAIMFYYPWNEIMDEKENEQFILANVIKTTNCAEALNIYANTRCPASIFLEANTEQELNDEIEKTKENYKDNDWLEANVYPFI